MVYIKPKDNSKFRLFCFPYAGGGSAFFYKWAQSLPSQIEICPVKLPGREDRISQTPFTKIEDLVRSLAQALRSNLDIPFAFFGHSMGAIVCFELARYLWQYGDRYPVRLFISGRNAPHLNRSNSPIHQLATDEFLQALRKLGGTPIEVLENAEIMEMLMPALRADFELVETYQYRDFQPLPCPITAFGGIDDPDVTRENLQAWQQHTTTDFKLNMLPGNHFFIHTHQDRLLSLLNRDLELIDDWHQPQSPLL